MNKKHITKELPIEEVPREKSFYLSVSYYDGQVPYVITYDKKEEALKYGDAVYEVKIPCKPKENDTDK